MVKVLIKGVFAFFMPYLRVSLKNEDMCVWTYSLKTEGFLILASKKIDFDHLIKKYTNPQAVKELDKFLDAMPMNVGYNALIAAGLAWLLAGCMILFASMESTKMAEIQAELAKVEALKPPVPVLDNINVGQNQLKQFVETVDGLYPGIAFKVNRGSLSVSGSLAHYAQFRGAISHVQSGGKSWQVEFKRLCVGRECKGPQLQADLNIKIVKVKDAPKT